MAIEYSLKLEEKLSESGLLEQLKSMGYTDNDVIELPKGIKMSQFRSTLGLNLYLTESGEYPYNAYETQFLRNEFVYESTLSFRFVNNLYNNETYEFVLSLVFNLMKNNNSNALFLSNGDNELCFFTKDCIYSENSSHVWDKGCFAEILKGYKYCNFDGNYIF
ncbi:hypothetical protein SAMN05661091_4921 [Paenibacillus uliginis N3/975]|uniref:Uncharacterized protein n=1 Tax=Paenibacillus uliginis N3/975 TaxID=1313296 RepID=A0A1X7HNW4_9BACL|nr:SitI3 family protein [Paenibacillus uliginis]SMF90175.1 hypothetical protein SAMN05661091_4921 [Paenibacillus uliginis N3/975]